MKRLIFQKILEHYNQQKNNKLIYEKEKGRGKKHILFIVTLFLYFEQ